MMLILIIVAWFKESNWIRSFNLPFFFLPEFWRLPRHPGLFLDSGFDLDLSELFVRPIFEFVRKLYQSRLTKYIKTQLCLKKPNSTTIWERCAKKECKTLFRFADQLISVLTSSFCSKNVMYYFTVVNFQI